MNPVILALLSPRYRRLVLELDALPVHERAEHFEEWLARQSDAGEIRAAVAAVDLDSPMPLDGDGAEAAPWPERQGPCS